LRAKRSNPVFEKKARLDCFVARAPRNDDNHNKKARVNPALFVKLTAL